MGFEKLVALIIVVVVVLLVILLITKIDILKEVFLKMFE